jgi:hypothetical protein
MFGFGVFLPGSRIDIVMRTDRVTAGLRLSRAWRQADLSGRDAVRLPAVPAISIPRRERRPRLAIEYTWPNEAKKLILP